MSFTTFDATESSAVAPYFDTAAFRADEDAFGLNLINTEFGSNSDLAPWCPAAKAGRYGFGSAADPPDPVTTTTPPAIIAAGTTSRSKRLLNTTTPKGFDRAEKTTFGPVLNRWEAPRRYRIARPVGNRVRTEMSERQPNVTGPDPHQQVRAGARTDLARPRLLVPPHPLVLPPPHGGGAVGAAAGLLHR
ncbi:hypothetical protein GCM10009630_54410 [Kribbella jejuensis]